MQRCVQHHAHANTEVPRRDTRQYRRRHTNHMSALSGADRHRQWPRRIVRNLFSTKVQQPKEDKAQHANTQSAFTKTRPTPHTITRCISSACLIHMKSDSRASSCVWRHGATKTQDSWRVVADFRVWSDENCRLASNHHRYRYHWIQSSRYHECDSSVIPAAGDRKRS